MNLESLVEQKMENRPKRKASSSPAGNSKPRKYSSGSLWFNAGGSGSGAEAGEDDDEDETSKTPNNGSGRGPLVAVGVRERLLPSPLQKVGSRLRVLFRNFRPLSPPEACCPSAWL